MCFFLQHASEWWAAFTWSVCACSVAWPTNWFLTVFVSVSLIWVPCPPSVQCSVQRGSHRMCMYCTVCVLCNIYVVVHLLLLLFMALINNEYFIWFGCNLLNWRSVQCLFRMLVAFVFIHIYIHLFANVYKSFQSGKGY